MIHYHGSPMSGNEIDVVKFYTGRHAMVSFAAIDDIGTIAEVTRTFCIDNGAFSHWKKSKGSLINLDRYYRFIESWHLHPGYEFCLIPDKIDGDEFDNRNLVEQWPIELKGGVPVWHLHESLEYLLYLTERFDMIALGSSGEYATPGVKKWWERISQAFTVICDKQGRPKTKVHGLRMLDPKIFTKLPFASADSTNAVRNCSSTTRYGMYRPPSYHQRAEVIAARIESHQSAQFFKSVPVQQEFKLEAS